MSHGDALTLYTGAFVDELARSGVDQAIVSPGSRSTPLALLLAEHPEINVQIHVDERSAAFYALGIAKATHKPVVLLCTSGTAAANYMPAVVEAYYSRIPLIVLTADRPHELRDIGAPQAIDQVHLFGKHVKWFVDMALPEQSLEMVRYARTVCARGIATSMRAPAGPIQINFPFREPLIPDLDRDDLFQTGKSHPISVRIGTYTLSENDWDELSVYVSQFNKGLIVCGSIDHNQAAFSTEIVKLAERLQFPIIADPLSQLRSSQHDYAIVDCYDSFLKNDKFTESYTPDIIIRFGAMPISKSLTLFLKQLKDAPQLVVDSGGSWRDPNGTVSEMIYADELLFCTEIVKRVATNKQNTEWLNSWKTVNLIAKEHLHMLKNSNELSEGKLVLELVDRLPEGTGLFVGNSMPIRDVDSFFHQNNKNISIYANRGANGIDGVISTALGVANSHQPLVLLIGDLTFYHDLNGLLAAKLHELNITIILVNNNGGGIFSFLPQSQHPKHFELLFGTPLDLPFEHAIQLYGGYYSKIENWEQFYEAFDKSINHDGLNVIEVPTIRDKNVHEHRELWKNVSQEISNWISRENR